MSTPGAIPERKETRRGCPRYPFVPARGDAGWTGGAADVVTGRSNGPGRRAAPTPGLLTEGHLLLVADHFQPHALAGRDLRDPGGEVLGAADGLAVDRLDEVVGPQPEPGRLGARRDVRHHRPGGVAADPEGRELPVGQVAEGCPL